MWKLGPFLIKVLRTPESPVASISTARRRTDGAAAAPAPAATTPIIAFVAFTVVVAAVVHGLRHQLACSAGQRVVQNAVWPPWDTLHNTVWKNSHRHHHNNGTTTVSTPQEQP